MRPRLTCAGCAAAFGREQSRTTTGFVRLLFVLSERESGAGSDARSARTALAQRDGGLSREAQATTPAALEGLDEPLTVLERLGVRVAEDRVALKHRR
jgi:hypothetical protein